MLFFSYYQITDQSELHSGNKLLKRCLLVIWLTDLTKHESRLFTRQSDFYARTQRNAMIFFLFGLKAT